jgi:GGDEF domain-containing protein
VQALPCYAPGGTLTGAIEVFGVVNDTVSLLRQIEALRHDTLTDILTGLGNRRYLEEMATMQLAVLENQERIGVSVSVGGTVSLSGDTLNSMIERADANMYECKLTGKNRVLVK